MGQQKRRVHLLAKELNVSSKAIIQKCKDEGVDGIKNHMSTLSAGLEATIREWFSEGTQETAVETSAPIDLDKVRVKKPRRKKTATEEVETGDSAVATQEAPGGDAGTADDASYEDNLGQDDAEDSPESPQDDTRTAAAESAATAPVESQPEAETPVQSQPAAAPAEQEPVAPAADAAQPRAGEAAQPVADGGDEMVDSDAAPTAQPDAAGAGELAASADATTATPVEKKADDGDEPVRPDAGAGDDKPRSPADAPEKPVEKQPVKAVGTKHVPAPAKLTGPRVVRYEPMESDSHPPRRPRRPAGDVAARQGDPMPGPVPAQDGDRGRRRGGGGGGGGGGRGRRSGRGGYGDRDLAERQERLAGAGGRRMNRRRTPQGGGGGASTAGPKTEATVSEPIRMKDFCSATGLSFMQLFKILKDEHNVMGNINMTLPTETAELLALHFGIELTVVPAKTKLDEVREEFADRKRNKLVGRPPVVTMLGHVDHGKTSLLDAIRETRVASREDGGITQHIGAHYVNTPHGRVTFLDTPGHEAFTAMRARGAKVTDVVVLVVAADDGLMPQTIEAINHAKAAEVPIVVALNKIDLGDQNKLKIFGQLAEHGLTPSGDWGGEVDVLPTSATTGEGIEELVTHLSDLSSLLELKADPALPAEGIVLEAETKPGVGAVVRVLIREGTLKVGSFVVCGNAAGKVRALLDDQGQRIRQAGPSIPVEVWGLDDVPSAGDMLYQLQTLQRCKEVAEEIRHDRVEENRQQTRKVLTLEEMFQQRDTDEIPELNVIVKGDVDGSLVALRQMLEEFPQDEVRLTMRHMGVGAVNDSDVLLASTCKGIIVAFRVEASVGARRLAEQHGVDIRPYRVIYNVVDDIKKALEGLLAPEERPESRGAAEVREVFNLSRGKGTIAGSFVSDGVIDRNHLAKIVRDGVVVREGCRFASLRRFRDDVNEVRKGMECGIRLEGFDDVHVGDVIETYEILKVARTLQMDSQDSR